MGMRWLDYAEGELGQRELRGAKHNPRILGYHATTSLGDWGRSRDEVAWCSSFVNWCFVKAGVEGTDNALARSWLRWGRKVELEDWELGDVMVIKRKKRGADKRTGSRGGYHVGFPYRVTGRYVLLLGGNQSDSVCFSRYRWRRYLHVGLRRAL